MCGGVLTVVTLARASLRKVDIGGAALRRPLYESAPRYDVTSYDVRIVAVARPTRNCTTHFDC